MEHSKSMQNPWAGLSSYEDPLKSSVKLKFCGRDNDTYDLARLIDDNFFVTLYGKSGIGKTSLLNAGIFPVLRKEQYTPISLRLGMTDESMTFQEIIINAIEHEIIGSGGRILTVNVVGEQFDRSATDYLWNYFARHTFMNSKGQVTFPVIVFDQFEEVFRQPASRTKAEILLSQLHYLIDENNALNDCIVDGDEYSYDYNFRFVVTVREDDLYRLEDSIDNNSLTSLKRCRYRLRALSKECAQDVILIPGEEYLHPSDKEKIVQTIINTASDTEENISTNLLSLICSRIFVDYSKSGDEFITSAIVDTFIKGNPFERFYNEATRNLDENEKLYIENSLVDSTGRRNSVPESDFLLHVRDGKILLEGDNRILQRISVSSGTESCRIELIHDSFCEPVSKSRQKRIQQKRRRQLATAIAIIFAVVLFAFGLYLILTAKNQSIQKNLDGMKIMQSRVVTELAEDIDNPAVSLAMLLDVLPEDLEKPSRPYTHEAGTALMELMGNNHLECVFHHDRNIRSAVFSNDGEIVLTLPKYDDNVKPLPPCLWDAKTGEKISVLNRMIRFAVFSNDGQRILTASDSLACVWDTKTCEIILTLKHNNWVNSAIFSKDGKSILTASDSTACIWNATTGKKNLTLKHNHWVESAVFSNDGKKILTASDSTACIWNATTGEKNLTLKHNNLVNSAIFSKDGKSILTASDSTACIWNATTGEKNLTLKHNHWVESAVFSNDGEKILTASDSTACIWNATTGEKNLTLKHDHRINSAIFSNDGKKILIASNNTACIWNATTGKKNLTLKHNHWVESAVFSNDGEKILTASNNTACIWNTTIENKIMLKHNSRINSADFSNDKKRIITASDDSTTCIWDAQTGEKILTLKHDHWVNYAVFSNDGERILTASDSTAYIWNATTGKKNLTLKHNHRVNYAAFSNDRERILTTYYRTAYLWDAKTGEKILTLKNITPIRSAIFSNDGKKIIIKSSHGDSMWDTRTGKALFTSDFIGNKYYLSKNEKLFLTKDRNKTICLWNKQIEEDIIIKHYNVDVLFAFFSNDGKRILTTLYNNTAYLWDTHTGEKILSLNHNYIKSSIVLSNDGKRVLMTSHDKCEIFDCDIQSLIDRGHAILNNYELSQEDKCKYYLD